MFGLCAASVQAADGEKLSTDQQKKRDDWIDSAIASLEKAIAAGWTDFKHMQEDSDLAILHELPRFKALIPQKD